MLALKIISDYAVYSVSKRIANHSPNSYCPKLAKIAQSQTATTRTTAHHTLLLHFIKPATATRFQMPNHAAKRANIAKHPTLIRQAATRTTHKYIIWKDGKINVCHHIKGHIPLLVYNSFKPYQFNISLPKFLVVTATS